MKTEYKKVSFRMNATTVSELQKIAEKEYLSLSAYIRKQLEDSLQKEVKTNE